MTSELWDIWLDSQPHSPAFNMAADEALLVTANHRRRPLLRFYQWDRKAVSIGYVQAIASAPVGYAAVRRPTGGGVVFHDFDLTYSIAFPAEHWLNTLDRTRSYDCINHAVQNALVNLNLNVSLSNDDIPRSVDRLTMVCFTNPTKYDIMLNGKKVGGSAQRRVREGLLHQASLHFGGPLPIQRNLLQSAIARALANSLDLNYQIFTPDPFFIGKTLDFICEKYDNTSWTNRR